MSDDFQPFATSGSGKSDAEVAFELVSKLKGQGVWGERNMADILDMFAECLDAAKGLRSYEGQNRVSAPINAQSSHSAAPAQTAPVQAQMSPEQDAQMQAAQIQAAQIEAQRQQAAQMQQQQHAQMQQQAQPVHVQQQAVAQAFKG